MTRWQGPDLAGRVWGRVGRRPTAAGRILRQFLVPRSQTPVLCTWARNCRGEWCVTICLGGADWRGDLRFVWPGPFLPPEQTGVCKTGAFPNRVWERGYGVIAAFGGSNLAGIQAGCPDRRAGERRPPYPGLHPLTGFNQPWVSKVRPLTRLSGSSIRFRIPRS